MQALFRVNSDFISGAKVQKIIGICKNLINFIKLIVRAERDKTFWREKKSVDLNDVAFDAAGDLRGSEGNDVLSAERGDTLGCLDRQRDFGLL